MKRLLLALLAAPVIAHASWFDFEAGVGVTQSSDMGDGTWYQQGVPHRENLTTPALMLGVSSDVWNSVRVHADYVYFGEVSASCLCVTDDQYNPHTHKASVPGYIPFNGHGHTQGLALTLDYGYTWHGWRFGTEAGPWLHWETWHVTHIDPAQPGSTSLDHRTVLQPGLVAGLRLEKGAYGLSYRYYRSFPQLSRNPTPGIVTGTHMLMATYRW